MTYAPPPGRIRLTISVTPEVHATFQRLADVGGTSISRSMGDWLGDTLEAADFMANTMEKARQAPKLVVQELHAYSLGLTDELQTAMKAMREGRPMPAASGAAGRRTARTGAGAAAPPPSNTGGKGRRSGRGGKP